MSRERKFNAALVSSVSAMSLMLSASFAAAQEAQSSSDPTDEVVVTGIRQSLEKSLDVKRNAKGIVDSINAEDIGKFPDSNLAESLQRVSGVSIDRSNTSGEGQYLTVRGFGADYNLVTLNGRMMPTSTLGDFASAPSTRSFDFANLAPETVSRVDVLKTGKSYTPSGGIGSTVNIHTTRPLDLPGFNATVGAKFIRDDSSDSSDHEISALIYNTWGDDRIGLSISAVQNTLTHTVASFRHNWRSGFERYGDYRIQANDEIGFDPASSDANGLWSDQLSLTCDIQKLDGTTLCPWPAGFNPDVVTNAPDDNALVANAGEASGYYVDDLDQERTNYQITFQARPLDNLTATVDYLSAKLEQEVNENRLTVWIDEPSWRRYGFETSWGEGNPATPVSATYTAAGANTWGRTLPDGSLDTAHTLDAGTDYDDLDNAAALQSSLTEIDAIGINLDWEVDERLNLELDYHSSTSESKPNGPYGSSATISSISKTFDTTSFDYTTDVPVISLGYKAPYDTLEGGTDPLYAPGRFLAGGTNINSFMENEIEQLQIRGSFDATDSALGDFIDQLDFGVSSLTNEVSYAFGEIQAGNWGGIEPDYGALGSTGEVGVNYDNALWAKRDNLQAYFSGLSGSDRIFPEIIRASYSDWFAEATAKIIAAETAANNPGLYQDVCGTNNVADCLVPYSQFNKIEEEINAIYLQASKDFLLSDMSGNITVGIRYEETDVTASSLVPNYTHITWDAPNELFAQTTGDDDVFETRTASYDNFLPNIDFNLDVRDDVKLRASYSETIGRQSYNDLKGATTINQLIRPVEQSFNGETGEGSRGNPGLEPLESENWDLSAEWYYGDLSYMSIGWFQKKVSNYVGTGNEYETYNGLTTPAFLADGTPQNYVAPAAGDPAPVGDDTHALALFKFSQPVASDREETIDGLEIAVQHDFSESELFGSALDGFGVIANFTIVETDANYENTIPNSEADQQFAIVGISDSYNIIAYYEDEALSTRLAYNWRDRFLNFSGDSSGYTEEYETLDFNISYTLPELDFIQGTVTLTYDGINLTEEGRRTFERDNPAYVTWVSNGHAKHYLGLRWKY